MRDPVLLLAVPAAGLGLGVLAADDDLAHLEPALALPIVLMLAGAGLAWYSKSGLLQDGARDKPADSSRSR